MEDFAPLGPPGEHATRPTARFNSILSIRGYTMTDKTLSVEIKSSWKEENA